MRAFPSRFLDHIGYILLGNLPSLIMFKCLSSLRVEWDSMVAVEENTLVVSNHRSLVDSWLIMHVVFSKLRCLRNYRYLPYHPAAVEHFFDSGWKRLVFGRFLKCLPIYRKPRGRQVFKTLDLCVDKLRGGTMIVFPEGTRTRTGRMTNDPRVGVGYLVYQAKPVVIPVYHNGTEKIAPVGGRWLSPLQTLFVRVGKPMELHRFYEMPNERDTWRQISENVLQPLCEMETDFLCGRRC